MIFFFQIIWIIMIFQDLLQTKIGFIGNLDEIFCIVSTIYAIILVFNKRQSIKFTKYELVAFNIFILYLLIGIISSMLSQIIDFKYAFLSMIMTVKGYILYFSCRIIFQYHSIKINMLNMISKVLKYCIYIFTFLSIINVPLGFLKTYDIRFGIKTVYMGFSHPTELAFFTIISMSIILLNYHYENKQRDEWKIIISSAILIIFTGRSKAIAFIVVYILLFYFIKIIKKFKIKYALLLIPIIIYIGLPRIVSELINGARGSLYRAGFSIAYDFFPFGSGFGTFGSYISKIHYSPLYYDYRISNVWGISKSMSSYITDTYWAMIMGEIGFIGIALLLLVLYFIFINFIKGYSEYKSRVIVLGLIGYTFITSIAEPIYSSNKSAALFITLSIFITIALAELQSKNEKYD